MSNTIYNIMRKFYDLYRTHSIIKILTAKSNKMRQKHQVDRMFRDRWLKIQWNYISYMVKTKRNSMKLPRP